jgi:steroid 5-alpha reductase family enzyme
MVVLAGVMLLFYVLGTLRKNHGLVDIAWGLGIGLLTVSLALKAPTLGSLQVVMAGLVVLWSLRLSGYLFLRNWGKPEDFRYAEWRRQWGRQWWWRSFFQVYVLQGCLQLVIGLPVVLTLGAEPKPLGWLGLLGAGLALGGLALETVADAQKARFKRYPENRERLIMSGLWRYSRHPNYFGEAVFWWGIGLLALRVECGWIGLLTAGFMSWLLLKVSGVPMLEAKWASRPEFEEYRKRTNRFVFGTDKVAGPGRGHRDRHRTG